MALSKLFAATGRRKASPRTARVSPRRDAATATMAGLWSRPTTIPSKCLVRKAVPQATSRVRAWGSARMRRTTWSTSASHPGRSRPTNRPLPRYQSSYSPARRLRSTPPWPCPWQSEVTSRGRVFSSCRLATKFPDTFLEHGFRLWSETRRCGCKLAGAPLAVANGPKATRSCTPYTKCRSGAGRGRGEAKMPSRCPQFVPFAADFFTEVTDLAPKSGHH